MRAGIHFLGKGKGKRQPALILFEFELRRGHVPQPRQGRHIYSPRREPWDHVREKPDKPRKGRKSFKVAILSSLTGL